MPVKHHVISTSCHFGTTGVQGAMIQFGIARMHCSSDQYIPLLLHKACVKGCNFQVFPRQIYDRILLVKLIQS